MMDWFGWHGPMGMGGLYMLLLLALVVLAVAVLMRWMLGSTDDPRRQRRTPLDILEERYASGEIGRAEYEEKRRDLGG